MRKNSEEQSKASRENGSKSHGPTSEAGKQKASKNSIRHGLFSRRQFVIEQLGEKEEGFEKLKKSYFDLLQPTNCLEKQPAMDVVENIWLRGRARRAEEQELANRLQIVQLQNDLMRADELEKLRRRFVIVFNDYVTGLTAVSRLYLPQEVEDARRELISTTEGVDFFLELVDSLKADLEIDGMLTRKQRSLLEVVRGSGIHWISNSRVYGLTLEDESVTTAMPDQHNDESSVPRQPAVSASSIDTVSKGEEYQDRRKMQRSIDETLIEAVAEALRERREKLEKINAAEASNRIAVAMLDPNTSDRFSRAQTMYERRMYRALAFLMMLRGEAPGKPLPVPKIPG